MPLRGSSLAWSAYTTAVLRYYQNLWIGQISENMKQAAYPAS